MFKNELNVTIAHGITRAGLDFRQKSDCYKQQPSIRFAYSFSSSRLNMADTMRLCKAK